MQIFIISLLVISLFITTYLLLCFFILSKCPDNDLLQFFEKENIPTKFKHLNVAFLNVEILSILVCVSMAIAVVSIHSLESYYIYYIIAAVAVTWLCVFLFQNAFKSMAIPSLIKKLFIFINYKLIRLYPTSVFQYHKQNVDDETTKRNLATRENTMLKDIIHFGNETVKNILTAHTDIVLIDYNTPYTDVLNVVADNKYSRIPVYSKSKDNIVGILYIKDLLSYLGKPVNFHWQTLIRPHICVPETKKIDNLLHEFQTKKIHFAVVIDEYGGVAGIATIEDIIEEIVGEIHDEFDDEKEPYIKINKNSYIFDAKTSTQTICKVFGIDDHFFDEFGEDANTLATLVIDIIGDLPRKHQVVKFKQFVFEILKMDARHISKVKVSRL